MAYQAVFKRFEKKYMLTLEQKEELLKVMADHMKLDAYFHVTSHSEKIADQADDLTAEGDGSAHSGTESEESVIVKSCLK